LEKKGLERDRSKRLFTGERRSAIKIKKQDRELNFTALSAPTVRSTHRRTLSYDNKTITRLHRAFFYDSAIDTVLRHSLLRYFGTLLRRA